jgi:hypothetical protein
VIGNQTVATQTWPHAEAADSGRLRWQIRVSFHVGTQLTIFAGQTLVALLRLSPLGGFAQLPDSTWMHHRGDALQSACRRSSPAKERPESGNDDQRKRDQSECPVFSGKGVSVRSRLLPVPPRLTWRAFESLRQI